MSDEKVVDPTLPTSEIEIGGKTYTMCMDLNSMAKAEAKLRAAGQQVFLLRELNQLESLDSVLTVFAASVQRLHPELSFDDARKLPGPASIYIIQGMLAGLWVESMPKAPDGESGPPLPSQ